MPATVRDQEFLEEGVARDEVFVVFGVRMQPLAHGERPRALHPGIDGVIAAQVVEGGERWCRTDLMAEQHAGPGGVERAEMEAPQPELVGEDGERILPGPCALRGL